MVNVPNSMTVLDELLPISMEMAKRDLRGIYNFTNPGCVSHNEVLQLYQDYIDPDFKWQNFTLEEQVRRDGWGAAKGWVKDRNVDEAVVP